MELKNLKAELARNGTSYTKAAEYMKMSLNSFSWKINGKKGREFSLSELAKLADWLSVSIDYLAGRTA